MGQALCEEPGTQAWKGSIYLKKYSVYWISLNFVKGGFRFAEFWEPHFDYVTPTGICFFQSRLEVGYGSVSGFLRRGSKQQLNSKYELALRRKMSAFKIIYLIKYKSHLCEPVQCFAGEEVIVMPIRTLPWWLKLHPCSGLLYKSCPSTLQTRCP